MKKPSDAAQIRELKERIDDLQRDRHALSTKLTYTEADVSKTREALSAANRKLSDAAEEARQWQARFDQLLTAISKR